MDEKNIEHFLKANAEDSVIAAYKKDIDVTLIRRNLKLTISQRAEQLANAAAFLNECRRAMKHATR